MIVNTNMLLALQYEQTVDEFSYLDELWPADAVLKSLFRE